MSPLPMAEPHSFSLVSVIPLVSDWATAQHSYGDHSLASNGKQPETFENVNEMFSFPLFSSFVVGTSGLSESNQIFSVCYRFWKVCMELHCGRHLGQR